MNQTRNKTDGRQKRKALGCVIGILAILSLANPVLAQNVVEQRVIEQEVIDTQREHKVKAVYLYSFGRFTRWPTQIDSRPPEPFIIGVVGASPVIESLAKVARKRTIRDKKILIKTFTNAQDLRTESCQIVFITRSVPAADTASLLLRLQNTSAITVTETSDRFPGTVVNFILDSGSIHFELNIEESQRKKLSMDARLLRQGRKMLPSSPPSIP